MVRKPAESVPIDVTEDNDDDPFEEVTAKMSPRVLEQHRTIKAESFKLPLAALPTPLVELEPIDPTVGGGKKDAKTEDDFAKRVAEALSDSFAKIDMAGLEQRLSSERSIAAAPSSASSLPSVPPSSSSMAVAVSPAKPSPPSPELAKKTTKSRKSGKWIALLVILVLLGAGAFGAAFLKGKI